MLVYITHNCLGITVPYWDSLIDKIQFALISI
jgi:hypothetical protein